MDRISAEPKYVQPFLDKLNPYEIHNVGGDCINPKCDYQITDQDRKDIEAMDGMFTCPKCDRSYNYYYDNQPDGPGGYTRSALTMRQMGSIGETIIADMGSIPQVGQITWHSPDYNSPLDFIIGEYGVEVKTNHSEATARFKLGGAAEREQKILMAQQMNLIPAIIGVRLNFYSDVADIFFRPQLTDTWIGNPQLQHVAKTNFAYLNPYKEPYEVPDASQLPQDDSTPGASDGIPF
jgi:hypothetical protein